MSTSNETDESLVKFRCGKCDKVLKVKAESRGGKAKCPSCGEIVQVPEAHPSDLKGAGGVEVIEAGQVVSPPDPMNKGVSLKNEEGGTAAQGIYRRITKEIEKVFIGQDELVQGALVALFSNGHVLIESVPGLGKTLFVRTLGKVLGCDFGRIQFTADLMPSDITGAPVFNMKSQEFEFRPGPVFTQLLLADEINRSPAKTHAALLEIMQERRVTIDGNTYSLELPFLVVATQNPIESEGTYNLPEAQLDRFMFNVVLDYPSFEEELAVVKNTTSDKKVSLSKVLTGEEILKYQQLIRKIPIADNVTEYAVKLVAKTRPNTTHATDRVNQFVSWGAGPRASQYLVIGAKCHAAVNGKFSPDIEDLKAVATPILRHRMVKNYKAEAEGISIEQLINELL